MATKSGLIAERSTYWATTNTNTPYSAGDYRCYWQIYYEQTDNDRLNNRTKVRIVYYRQKYKNTEGDVGSVMTIPSGSSYCNIDGSQLGSPIYFSQSSVAQGENYYLDYLGERETYIYHSEDGTGSFTWQGFGFGKGTGVSRYSLPTIDRGSVLSDVPNFDVENEDSAKAGVIVYSTKYVSSYYDRLKIYVSPPSFSSSGQLIKTINNFSSGTKVTFTEAELNAIYSVVNTGSNAKFTFELSTYSDNNYSTQIGNASEKQAVGKLMIINPTFGSFYYEDINQKTVDLTGSSAIIVKGYSTLMIGIASHMEAKAHTRGASISHYIIDGKTVPYSSSGVSTSIPNYSKDYISMYAVDTRGDASPERNISFLMSGRLVEYTPLLINDDYDYERNNNEVGEIVTINFSGTWWNGNFGKDPNKLEASYKYKKSSSNTYIEGTKGAIIPSVNGNNFVFKGAIDGDGSNKGFDISQSYDIIVTIKDELSNGSITYDVHSGEPAIAIFENKCALGAAYNETLGGIQLWGDCYLNGKAILNSLYPVGAIYLSTTSTDPSTIFGGTWERIEDVFLLASGNTYSPGSTGGSAKVTLSVSQIPAHDHRVGIDRDAVYSGSGACWSVHDAGTSGSQSTVTTGNAGGGEAHENMPPYLAVYAWKRIS